MFLMCFNDLPCLFNALDVINVIDVMKCVCYVMCMYMCVYVYVYMTVCMYIYIYMNKIICQQQ